MRALRRRRDENLDPVRMRALRRRWLIPYWDRSVALPPHVRDVFELSSVATLNRALVRMSAEESVDESVERSSLGSRMSAGESAVASADESAVVSSAGSQMSAEESAEAVGSSVGSRMSAGKSADASADE